MLTFCYNLLSVSQLLKELGIIAVFLHSMVVLQDLSSRKLMEIGVLHNGLYVLKVARVNRYRVHDSPSAAASTYPCSSQVVVVFSVAVIDRVSDVISVSSDLQGIVASTQWSCFDTKVEEFVWF